MTDEKNYYFRAMPVPDVRFPPFFLMYTLLQPQKKKFGWLFYHRKSAIKDDGDVMQKTHDFVSFMCRLLVPPPHAGTAKSG
jgi:hypothetical protein